LKLLDAHALADHLVAGIATSDSFEINTNSIVCLQHICCINGPKINVDVVVAAGAVEQVVQHYCLSSPAAKLQEAACKFLVTIFEMPRPNARHFRAIISAGNIPRLCQLLSKGKTTATKETAARLLAMIETVTPGSTLTALAAAKSAKHLKPLLASLCAPVLASTATLLHELLRTCPTETLPLAAKAGVVRHLVVLLGSSHGRAQQDVCCCIAALAQDQQCSRALAAAVAAGAVPKLVAALADAGTPPEVLQPAAAALSAMTRSSLLSQLRQAGAVRALVAALRRYHCAAGAAAAAAAPGPSSSTSVPLQETDGASVSARNCLRALSIMASAEGASQQQRAAALQAAISAGGLAQVVRLLGAADQDVALYAANSMTLLLHQSPASVKPLAEAGAIEALAALLPGSTASALPAAAALALNAIRSASPSYLPQLGQAVCSRPGWDTMLAGMLSGRERYPLMPVFDSPAKQARGLQEPGLMLLYAAADPEQRSHLLAALQAACQAACQCWCSSCPPSPPRCPGCCAQPFYFFRSTRQRLWRQGRCQRYCSCCSCTPWGRSMPMWWRCCAC
jgi:hypothetical protein